MIQVLCYTGRGFDTCWRPASVATNVVQLDYTLSAGYMNCSGQQLQSVSSQGTSYESSHGTGAGCHASSMFG